mmetsp:Transcript_32342/g.37950  ORF Transcript_32342/g.37950 Transcript_32342/m.37950 type:complete len:206 (+) Transcript_32342:99-716(+)
MTKVQAELSPPNVATDPESGKSTLENPSEEAEKVDILSDGEVDSLLNKCRGKEEPNNKDPRVMDLIAQSSMVASAAWMWRATWYCWDFKFGIGLGSALGSLALGIFMIVTSRSSRSLRKLLPVKDAKTSKEWILRIINCWIVIVGVCLFWRGCWSFTDNVLPVLVSSKTAELIVCFCLGAFCVAFLNLPYMNQYSLHDQIALMGG